MTQSSPQQNEISLRSCRLPSTPCRLLTAICLVLASCVHVSAASRWKRVNIVDVDVDTRLVRAVFSRGGRGWVFGEGGALFATRDAGETWVRLQIPTRHLLLGGTFIDDDRGWLVGAGATILETSDGGDTWHLSKLTDAEGVRFTAASFVDNRLGWAVGLGGKVFRTINGGRTWQPQNSGVAVDLLDV